MTPSSPNRPGTTPVDEDLLEQAKPGHGIPSQDPNPAAQVPLDAESMQRESQSVLMGAGGVAGMAAGAAVGVALGGPAGVVVGATLGAVAGALDGAAVGNPGEPTEAGSDGTSSVHLHIRDTGGDGRPVVLIHGWPLSSEAWRAQVSALQAAHFRVVTYDRRGFGQSDKPAAGYDYDTLADDLQSVIEQCDLQSVTLVGFSMGGGEVARYVARFGESRLRSVVFAAAVPPCLMQSADNPDGPLTPDRAQQKRMALEQDRSAFLEQFTRDFFSAHGVLQVTEPQRQEALTLCHQSAAHAALACMESFSSADFRADLKKVTVPTLVIHGDADAIVPFEGSGQRTHHAVEHSSLVVVKGAPHGLNVSHAPAFNDALLTFLAA